MTDEFEWDQDFFTVLYTKLYLYFELTLNKSFY